MNRIPPLLLLVLTAMLFSGCKLRKEIEKFVVEFKKIADSFENLQEEVVPADSLTMALLSGALTELASDESSVKYDSISARLNRTIKNELNRTFKELDASPAVKKVVAGVVDTLTGTVSQDKLGHFIDSLTRDIGKAIGKELEEVFATIPSDQNKKNLDELIQNLFKNENSDSLSAFLTAGINGIKLDSLGTELSANLIDKKLQPSLDSLARKTVRAIFSEINKKENKGGLFGDFRHILWLGAGLLGALMALFFI